MQTYDIRESPSSLSTRKKQRKQRKHVQHLLLEARVNAERSVSTWARCVDGVHSRLVGVHFNHVVAADVLNNGVK